MKSFAAIIFIYSSFILLSCNNNPAEPEDNTPPGKRDYVWSVDSVDSISEIRLSSIWGSSPKDVWGIDPSRGTFDCFWHYDGTKWKRVVWDYSAYLWGVWGTSQADVWAFGKRYGGNPLMPSPFIMHFGGNKWAEIGGDKTQMPLEFTDIYPIRKNHFWVSSFDHVSEYKDGSWKKYFIGENYFIQSIGGEGGNVYLTAYIIGGYSLYLMKLIDNNFQIIEKTLLLTEGIFGRSGLLSANNKIYTFERGVYSRKSIDGNFVWGNWVKELTLPNGLFYNSFARNNKDIWAVGKNTLPYHYNGQNWSPVVIGNLIQDSHFTGIWGDGEEIFMCDTHNGIIYHGR